MLKRISGYHKKLRFKYIKTAALVIATAAFFLPSFVAWESTGDNMFTVSLNGIKVGVVGSIEDAMEQLREARRGIASKQEEMVFIDVDMSVKGQEVLVGHVDDAQEVRTNMETVLLDNIKETLQRSYVVKVNDSMVNLSSMEEVKQLLQGAVDQYDTEGVFAVQLVQDSSREFNVLTTQVEETKQKDQEEAQEAVCTNVLLSGGIQDTMFAMFEDVEPVKEKEFSDFDLGLKSVDFAEEVEIVEAYVDTAELVTLESAAEQLIKAQEVNTEYIVVSGDTLSEISIRVNIPMDKLIEMNSSLQDENTTLQIGQKLTITVPEPELSVDRTEEVYYEEIYDADIIYVDEDSWYTTQKETLQEPSAGFRKVVANVSYRNEKEQNRDIVKEEVIMEAIPKIVKRGTKIPPTYLKPISGGRLSSGFGRRKSPTKGASSYHKGVDWATPVGTGVYASSGGTVTKAGWGGSYGYVIFVNHVDGRQTRYAHLSKVLVSVGQKVSQSQKIGLSGNTGVSTGPHIHFEILINGSPVNPLNYLN